MNNNYHLVYSKLYKDYISKYEKMAFFALEYSSEYGMSLRYNNVKKEYELLMQIDNAIRNASRSFPEKIRDYLRPDAKYFLLVNYHLLIIRPLIMGPQMRRRLNEPRERNLFSPNELRETINSDINLILNKANDSIKDDTKEEITGHTIVDTISNNWGNLKSTKFNVWG